MKISFETSREFTENNYEEFWKYLSSIEFDIYRESGYRDDVARINFVDVKKIEEDDSEYILTFTDNHYVKLNRENVDISWVG